MTERTVSGAAEKVSMICHDVSLPKEIRIYGQGYHGCMTYLLPRPVAAKVLARRVRDVHQVLVARVDVALRQADGHGDHGVAVELLGAARPLLVLALARLELDVRRGRGGGGGEARQARDSGQEGELHGWGLTAGDRWEYEDH